MNHAAIFFESQIRIGRIKSMKNATKKAAAKKKAAPKKKK
jgi:hypothetical protein